jgi:hypothetical protein
MKQYSVTVMAWQVTASSMDRSNTIFFNKLLASFYILNYRGSW